VARLPTNSSLTDSFRVQAEQEKEIMACSLAEPVNLVDCRTDNNRVKKPGKMRVLIAHIAPAASPASQMLN
jgi:hypothetical protein